jgi:hypothetical protein
MSAILCVACRTAKRGRIINRRISFYIGDISLCPPCRTTAQRLIESHELDCEIANKRRDLDFAEKLLEGVRSQVDPDIDTDGGPP